MNSMSVPEQSFLFAQLSSTENQSDTPSPPPEYVIQAFSIPDITGELLYSDVGAWVFSSTVLTPAYDPAVISYSATVRDELSIPGMRIAQPLRSKDGRHTVSGWHADTYVSGVPQRRCDEAIDTSFHLHRFLKDYDRPRFLSTTIHYIDTEADIFYFADQISFADDTCEVARQYVENNPISRAAKEVEDEIFEMLDYLVKQRKRTHLPAQLVHGDLYASLLFFQDLDPGLADFTFYFRPKQWAAALIAIDALTWGGENEELLGRWAKITEWENMLCYALIFRLLVFLFHPYAVEVGFYALRRAFVAVHNFLN